MRVQSVRPEERDATQWPRIGIGYGSMSATEMRHWIQLKAGAAWLALDSQEPTTSSLGSIQPLPKGTTITMTQE